MVDAVAQPGAGPVRIAEVGAGTGTMLDRMREWGFFASMERAGRAVTYHAWELSSESAARLTERLAASPEVESWRVFTRDAADGPYDQTPYDLVVAHAVLDLFRPDVAAEMLARLLDTSGVAYASIVFDGATFMEPAMDERIDEEILRLYHRSMGGGWARRHLRTVREYGFSVAEVGSSDWIVPPRGDRTRADEQVLLSTILDMVKESVGSLIDDGVDTALDKETLHRWIAHRREQVERGELLFVAHQFDFLARR